MKKDEKCLPGDFMLYFNTADILIFLELKQKTKAEKCGPVYDSNCGRPEVDLVLTKPINPIKCNSFSAQRVRITCVKHSSGAARRVCLSTHH